MNYKQASLKKYEGIRHLIVEIGKGEELMEELTDKLINTICPYCTHFGARYCKHCPLRPSNICSKSGAYWKLRLMVEGRAKFNTTKALKWTDEIIDAIKKDIEVTNAI